MNISCNVIKDLLPLYAEDMVSNDSREVVEKHLRDCVGCRSVLEEMKRESTPDMRMDEAPLKRVEQGIRQRRWRTALLVFFATATLFFGLCLYLFTPEYLSAEEAIAAVMTTEEGYPQIAFTSAVQGSDFRETKTSDDEGGQTEATIRAWRYRLIDPRQSKPLTEDYVLRMDVDRVWYSASKSGEEDTLLWGQNFDGGRITLPGLSHTYWFFLALIGTAAFAVGFFLLRKKKLGKACAIAGAFCGSFCLCSLVITGGEFASYHDSWTIGGVLILSFFLTGTIYHGWRLWKLCKLDSRI